MSVLQDPNLELLLATLHAASDAQTSQRLPKTITVLSALAPFVAAFVLGNVTSFQLAPWLLAGYLINERLVGLCS